MLLLLFLYDPLYASSHDLESDYPLSGLKDENPPTSELDSPAPNPARRFWPDTCHCLPAYPGFLTSLKILDPFKQWWMGIVETDIKRMRSEVGKIFSGHLLQSRRKGSCGL